MPAVAFLFCPGKIVSWRRDVASSLASSAFLPKLWQKEERRRSMAEWISEEVKEVVEVPDTCIRNLTWQSRDPLAVLPASC